MRAILSGFAFLILIPTLCGALATSQTARDVGATPNTVSAMPVQIFGQYNNTLFTFDLDPPPGSATGTESKAEVFTGYDVTRSYQYPVWEMHRVSADEYIFTNKKTGAPLVIYHGDEFHDNYLFTIAGAKATTFAVQSAGGGEKVIKISYTNLVVESIYDHSSMRFGQAALRPENGTPAQRWRIVHLEDRTCLCGTGNSTMLYL
ncbi:hypothetical protein MKEN_00628900 [Mycena kentingensis (nom. inval.)]|nr:hypothetical protein MKEN_00628900 [Mycena kentingensis (nom. inval.)]